MAKSDSFLADLIGYHDVVDQGGYLLPRRHTLEFRNALVEDKNGRTRITLSPRPVWITPSAVSSSQDDWAPTGVAGATDIRVESSTASWTLTGLSASGLEVYEKRIWNRNTVASGYAVTLAHADTDSAAGNRFTCPGGVDFVLAPGYAAKLIYDLASQTHWVQPCLT